MTKVINYYRTSANQPSKSKKVSLKLFNFILVILIAGLGAFHLINISDLTAKGFVLRELKSQVGILASANLEGEEKVNSLQSYYALNMRTEGLNMVAVGEIDYLVAHGSSVARR